MSSRKKIQDRLKRLDDAIIFNDLKTTDADIENLVVSFGEGGSKYFFEYRLENLIGIAEADKQDLAKLPVKWIKDLKEIATSEYEYIRDGSYFNII